MAGGGVGVSTRVATTTIEEWAKKVSEETERYLVLLALLKKKGRIEYGCSGGQMRWVVRKQEHELQGFSDMVPVNIARVDTKTSATLPWRGYYVSDAITLREKLEQGGPEAMIKIFANREEIMRRGAIRRLAQEIFKDGNLAVNSEAFHGVESFCGIGAQTNTDSLATDNNDTYGGLSTGVGDIDSEFTRLWTPTIVNTGKVVSGTTQDWEDFADEYIRKFLIETSYGNGPDDSPDLVLLTKASYERLLNLLDDKERIPVTRGSNIALTQLGFGNHVMIDGCSVMWGAEVPTTDASPYGEDGVTVNGYGFTTGRMQLKVLGSPGSKNLFTAKVDFNTSYRADEIFMHLLGNLKFESPRHFGKLANIASVAS